MVKGPIFALFSKNLKITVQTTISTTTISLALIIVLTATTGMVSVYAANLVGTSGPDTLTGTNNDDNIFGLAGNDRITDGFGSDNIFAGRGDDMIELVGTIGPNAPTDPAGTQDTVYGQGGRDNIDSHGDSGFRLIFGGSDDDIIAASGESHEGRILGEGGNDEISVGGDVEFEVRGGPGNDEINGASECAIHHAYGDGGNDIIISPEEFSRGGSGNDIIEFADCGGVAFGDGGNDELRGGEQSVELHGGSGDDILEGVEGEDDQLFGEGDDDTLTGDSGADSFSCGSGIDTITDFNAAEGDTKTADCENF